MSTSPFLSQDLAKTIIFPDTGLIAGTNWQFKVQNFDYGDGTWAGQIVFAATTARLVAPASVDGNIFSWDIAGADTARLLPQPYQFQVSVTKGTDKFVLQTGGVKVVVDIGNANWVGTETILQKDLAACDKTLLALLSQKVQMVTFGTKQYTLWDVAKLWQVRNEIYQRVQDERAKLIGNRRSNRIIPWFRNM